MQLTDVPEPLSLTRPLALLDGHVYAATRLSIFVPVEIASRLLPGGTRTPGYDQTELLILRDDGVLLGDDTGVSPEELDLTVDIPDLPSPRHLISASAVSRCCARVRPDPAEVFARLVAVIDHFVDFDHSLAPQPVMCRLIACYILSTWFVESFNQFPFLLVLGEHGSGKTRLLSLISELAYLGRLVDARIPPASLRALMANGATLAFDDADLLFLSRNSDSILRALILSGTHRGASIPVREFDEDHVPYLRNANIYCPRLFSVTPLTDPDLASRALVIPLVRTADRGRANADPLDATAWPHDRRALVDDFWSLALAHLPHMHISQSPINARARLVGSALNPWRPILAIASWLELNGVPGLFETFDSLSVAYQEERTEFQPTDLVPLLLRVLQSRVPDIKCDSSDSIFKGPRPDSSVTLDTTEITRLVLSTALDLDLGVETNRITPERIGHLLSRLRFERAREGGTGKRQWKISTAAISRLSRAYNLPALEH